MAGDGKVPINVSVRAAFTFLQSSLPQTWRAGVLLAVLTTFAQAAVNPNDTLAGFGLFFLAEAGWVVYLAYLLRLALRQDGAGFMGLRFGADEARLLGVLATLAFLVLLMTIVGVIVFSFVLTMTLTKNGIDPRTLENNPKAMEEFIRSALAGADGFMLIAVLLFFGALIVWLLGRLSLAYAATMGEGRFMALSTFSWTKGNLLHVLAVLFLVATPILSATLIVGAIAPTKPGGGSALLQVVEMLALQLVQFCIQAPLSAGAYAFLYKGLRPPNLAAPRAP